MSEDPWAPLRKATSARIALGRTGGSLPTARRLEFQFAHAKARDAVLRDFDEEKFAARLASGSASGHEVLHAQSAARTRKEFLLRPDLGRRLSGPSREFWMVDAIDCRLLTIGHRHLMAEDINRFKSKELSFRLRNDLNPRVPDFAFPKTFRGDQVNHIAVLGR